MDLRKLSSFNANRVQDSVGDELKDRIDVNAVLSLLYRALSEECQAWYQYWIVAPFLVGEERANIESTYEEFQKDELYDHAVKVRNRINELGGNPGPVASPEQWSLHAVAKYQSPLSPYGVYVSLLQNIKAEKEAIKTYTEICDFTKGKDYITYTMAKEILADEQDHLQTLEDYQADLLAQNPSYSTVVVEVNPVNDSTSQVVFDNLEVGKDYRIVVTDESGEKDNQKVRVIAKDSDYVAVFNAAGLEIDLVDNYSISELAKGVHVEELEEELGVEEAGKYDEAVQVLHKSDSGFVENVYEEQVEFYEYS